MKKGELRESGFKVHLPQTVQLWLTPQFNPELTSFMETKLEFHNLPM